MIYVNTASVLEDVANRLTAAMGDNPRVTAVMLNCSDSTAHRRLTGREKGTELMRHIQRSDLNGPRAQPARSPLGPPPGTDDRTISDLAAEIISLASWTSHQPSG
jgi:hypothetical protein